jgi:hypothetical protein
MEDAMGRYVSGMEETRNAYNALSKNLKGINH